MPNLNQSAFNQLKPLLEAQGHNILLIKGPAGTGKTTLVKHLIKWIEEEEIGRPYLLATTGRAAKILREKTGSETYTVHQKIYGFIKLHGHDDAFSLKGDNQLPDKDIKLMFALKSNESDGKSPIYFIDESSMISDTESVNDVSFASFGSGKLLSDLMEYAADAKIVFIGDEFQLPPVADDSFSPALDSKYLTQKFNARATEIKLTVIHRFRKDGYIFYLSDYYRNRTMNPGYRPPASPTYKEDAISYYGFTDFFNSYFNLIKDGDFNRATYIVPSNRLVDGLNTMIRSKLYPGQPKVQRGDLLLITQNSPAFNFYNGDLVVVKEIKMRRMVAGLSMMNLKVEELVSKREVDVIAIEDLLYSGRSNLDKMQYQKLMIDFSQRMKAEGFKPKDPQFLMAMSTDTFLNALRVKFGYALTCHKAQGGEWPDVFIRTTNSIGNWPHPRADKWKYRAITRASERIHFINGTIEY